MIAAAVCRVQSTRTIEQYSGSGSGSGGERCMSMRKKSGARERAEVEGSSLDGGASSHTNTGLTRGQT